MSISPWERRYPTGHEKDRQPENLYQPLWRASLRSEPFPPGNAGIRPAKKGIVNLTIYTQPLWRVAVPGLRLGVSLSLGRRYLTGQERDRTPELAIIGAGLLCEC